MKIIGCDFHPSYQQFAMVDTETGEASEGRLGHEQGEARRFYEALRGQPVHVGMEAMGNSQWFEQMLAEMGHELWLGDAAEIRRLVLRHRQKLVEMRSQVKNQLQHLALNQGVRRRRKLWSREGRAVLEALPLKGWTAQRRKELLAMLEQFDRQVAEKDRAVGVEAERRPEVRLLMTHPGVGPVVGLAYVLTIGPASRFPRGKQVASYLGLIPRERSSGGRQKLGSISKQGNTMMRTLLVEAAQTASRFDEELRRDYCRLKARKHSALARVMVARKLAVRMYWMLRERQDARKQGSPSHSVVAG
jgi:transposase